MARPERERVEEELLDPTAISRNYRRQRIKRRHREERAYQRNLARLRFWLALTAVISLFHTRIDETTMRRINRGSGALVAIFGLVVLIHLAIKFS